MSAIYITNAFLYLMIYSFMGWACESIYVSVGRRKLINSGFLYGPFCPIYGFGAIFVIFLLSPLADNPILVFFFGILITSLIEYFTSWLLEMLFHVMWWDYSHHRFNINGRVCLLNSFLFGCMSIFVIYFLHPPVADFVENIALSTRQIAASILFIYLITDLVLSTLQLISFKQQLSQFEIKLEEIKTTLANQIPEINLDMKEKVENFFENRHDLDDLRNQLHQYYDSFRSNRKQRRFRNSFPHLKLSNRKNLQGLSEYLKKQYENANRR